ncbi:hypothetical protein VNI00_001749 [Paramarasmius palmivorus]|uniref:Uncharacterized protein n=1 Tax=Paramarasmius palmivorus TaxID=297713 RepID=A0AAW0E1E1_9AGAR
MSTSYTTSCTYSSSSPKSKKSPRKKSKSKTTTRTRTLSANEIARNQHHFEVWSSHQNLEEACWDTDIPADIKAEVEGVLDVNVKWEWEAEGEVGHKELLEWATQSGFDDPHGLGCAYAAWTRLKEMQSTSSSSRKWTEADYAANVYSVLRSPALKSSHQHVQCSLSLPSPSIPPRHSSAEATRILATQAVVPDCAIFVPAPLLEPLAPHYKSLARVHRTKSTSAAAARTSFRYQSTPCTTLPDSTTTSNSKNFEFISALFEDKQPNWLHGYRQNRMGCASVARQLLALGVRSPVWGLVWCEGRVRVHVDWAEGVAGDVTVYSAMYAKVFDLSHLGDMVKVYNLIRKIDSWTTDAFVKHVTKGVSKLAAKKGQGFVGWRRAIGAGTSGSVDAASEGKSASRKGKENRK